jgi:hypothetical protein
MTVKEIKAYLAEIGRKGGQATGARKARSPEHYRKMVEARSISQRAVAARKAKAKRAK